ncbi:MAG: S8 family serine peptidase [Elainellaceae cyanobacterium]
MLNLDASTTSGLLDSNFGYASIADIGLGESLDQLFQRSDALLNRESGEDIEDAQFRLYRDSLGAESTGYALDSAAVNAASQLDTQTVKPAPAPPRQDLLTGQSVAQPLVGSRESAIAMLDQALSDINSDIDGEALPASITGGSWRIVEGDLTANRFTIDHGYSHNVISGNGNVNFGDGAYDWIDLSYLNSSAVVDSGFTRLNTGDGARVFDTFHLGDGSAISFEGIERVAFADTVLDLAVTPNDTFFNDQWNLHITGVHTAWRFTQGSEDVLVGVQDTGLGLDGLGQLHEDLNAENTLGIASNIGDDFFRNVPGQGQGARTDSHGTAVQGIIAAESNNGIGVSGINWESNVLAVDVLDNNAGDQSPAQATANMIDYARQQGQRLVINMSFGGGSIDPALEQLIADSQEDALFVISTGNSDQSSLFNPASLAASYSNVIAVGASWGTETVFGETVDPGTRISYPGMWGSNYGFGITLMGPSEVFTTAASPDGFGYQAQFNGTSAAAPNVAGIASLVWSANSELSASTVATILAQTAYDLGAEGYDFEYGNGLVNADAAVRRAIALA